MQQTERGVLLRSKPYTFSAGSQVQIDPLFLRPALSRMRAPVVRELIFHLNLSGTGGAGGLLAEDAYKSFGRIKLKDRGGVFYDLPGTLARIVNQLELGDKAFTADAIASGSNDADHDTFVRVTFDVERAKRGADFAVPLTHFTEGGEIAVSFQAPPTLTIGSGTLKVYAIVHDERVREVKSRMVWRETAITAVEDDYMVGGSLRAAFVSSDKGASAGYTALSAVSALDSKTFEWTDLDTKLLVEEYRRLLIRDQDADDEFLASTRNAIGLVIPSKGQAIGKMQDLKSFHVDVEDSITSGRMVTCVVEDRHGGLAAEWMGYNSVADYSNALRNKGVVASKGKAAKPVRAWDPKLVRRLPVRIPRG